MERLIEYIAVIFDIENTYPGSEDLPMIRSNEDLELEFRAGNIPEDYEGIQVHRFSTSVSPEVAISVGRGYFFINNWTADGTVSFVKPLKNGTSSSSKTHKD